MEAPGLPGSRVRDSRAVGSEVPCRSGPGHPVRCNRGVRAVGSRRLGSRVRGAQAVGSGHPGRWVRGCPGCRVRGIRADGSGLARRPACQGDPGYQGWELAHGRPALPVRRAATCGDSRSLPGSLADFPNFRALSVRTSLDAHGLSAALRGLSGSFPRTSWSAGHLEGGSVGIGARRPPGRRLWAQMPPATGKEA